MFSLVSYPSSVPTENLETSYKRQNQILEHTKYLHTSFDGIILSNLETENISLPNILAGSICLFCETLFYTNTNIILIDNNTNDGMRFISLTFNIQNNSLDRRDGV